MLSKPNCGWSDFSLNGTSTYGLSYLDDIAFEWLDQAIHGLQTMQPFCVKGFLEPNRFLCVVSYWNCHIIIEDSERDALNRDDIVVEYAHTSMLAFCKELHRDISENVDAWAGFAAHGYHANDPLEKKKKVLQEKLKTLQYLILSREAQFGENRCFL